MPDDQPWGRRLVVCCDGTWQSSVSGRENVPSNVTKLCRLIARIGLERDNPSKKWHQVVYYDSGIGTGDISQFESGWQGGTGAGLAENVIEAYNFIVMNYEPGDEIFCFGFSRGAYTARAVAGLVSDIGVMRPIDMEFFPEVYRAYTTNEKGFEFRETKAWEWFVKGKLSKEGEQLEKAGTKFLDDEKFQAEVWEIPPHGELAINPASRRVKVVGVWDTVGSLGVPDVIGIDNADKRLQFGFHNVKLSQNIEHAYQALALNERRESFRPTLWYIPYGMTEDVPDLKQVWFPGVHINCGGGSDDCQKDMEGDLENISMATLTWMLQCVSPFLTIDKSAFNDYLHKHQQWLNKIRFACTYHHTKSESTAQRLWHKVPNILHFNETPDALIPTPRDPPHAHKTFDYGWGIGPLKDPFSGIYYLNGTHPRDPGHEAIEAYHPKAKEQQWTPLTDLGRTHEYIHPIVYHRRLVRGWDAYSPLRQGWTRMHKRLEDDNKERFWWYKTSEADEAFRDGKPYKALPEWAILPEVGTPGPKNYEREWYRMCEKSEATVRALAKARDIDQVDGLGRPDFLKSLDVDIDFGVGKRATNQWP
ncbi:hypothetical protein P153DRAFT_382281 [Dothidotthia symphoricarpi CBS 119687]|uniref:T6SS Phospholipase effector Tle1-like catalytic domain-containing protein n=1 Tax=Dothidotthia symphoricarpi CBS 119687 TaxID=1392245 RepID=A0A6A6AL15_9PLEO|nr:uncharacterized protein P153DRAFT_382281 [Dothidotthia symphoricarpi CBS 119687]KAF2132662.1 hypothetical protein P153DRAFT_382281 [Dothidotthia symphoricarpi CBS 119687]